MISVIITTHGQALELPTMLGCLSNQREFGVGKNSRDGSPVKWVAGDYLPVFDLVEPIIVCDGPLLGMPSDAEGWPAQVKLITCPLEGGVGHHTREPGIEAATQPWITLTNSDNYFVAGWLSHIMPYLENPKVKMVCWGMVNNLWAWQAGPPRISRGFIDLSCVAVRSEIAKEVGFPFRDYDGDYDYIHTCFKKVALGQKKDNVIVTLPEILCVHN